MNSFRAVQAKYEAVFKQCLEEFYPTADDFRQDQFILDFFDKNLHNTLFLWTFDLRPFIVKAASIHFNERYSSLDPLLIKAPEVERVARRDCNEQLDKFLIPAYDLWQDSENEKVSADLTSATSISSTNLKDENGKVSSSAASSENIHQILLAVQKIRDDVDWFKTFVIIGIIIEGLCFLFDMFGGCINSALGLENSGSCCNCSWK